MQFRTVPGQTVASIEADLRRVLADIKREHPAFNCVMEIPAKGTETTWNQAAMVCPADHPLVMALAEGQTLASGKPAYVGAHGRIGNVGDGNVIQDVLGIPTVQYGPGRHPHLQGMADARRARTALRPGDGGQGRGPRDRQAVRLASRL